MWCSDRQIRRHHDGDLLTFQEGGQSRFPAFLPNMPGPQHLVDVAVEFLEVENPVKSRHSRQDFTLTVGLSAHQNGRGTGNDQKAQADHTLR
jgi:hypothetical protein